MPQVLPKRRSHSRAKRRKPAIDPGKGWRLRRAGPIAFFTADALSALPWLVHGFSTRIGGNSILGSERVLNLGFTEWDRRDAVEENRRRFFGGLGAERMPLLAVRQIHSDVVYCLDAAPSEPPRGDAIITARAGLLASIQTADCVPILLADRAHQAVAAIHAGWRGTLARIVEKTLGRMRQEFGTKPRGVSAALGPAIGRCSYDVGPEIAKAFAGQFAGAAEWFDGPFERLAGGGEPNPLPWLTMMPPGHQPPPERVQLDLHAANRWQLIQSGVLPRNIAVSPLCTACHTDLLFSYRWESGGGSKPTGRMMAAIGIRPRKN